MLFRKVKKSGTPIIDKTAIVTNTKLNQFIKIGAYSKINTVSIGSFSYIGDNSRIFKCKIGKFCSIANDVQVGGGEHPTSYISTSPVFYSLGLQCGTTFTDIQRYKELEDTYIGNDVWIGRGAFIKQGIIIGDGAIIAAGSVVTKDVPNYAIIAGVPGKIIRYRYSQDIIEKLVKIKWWDFPYGVLRENVNLFNRKVDNQILNELESLNEC